MPTYQYFCDSNQQTIEVQHSMKEQLRTWGEVCAKAGVPAGTTSPQAAVERLISGGLMGTVSGGTPTSSQVTLPMASCCGNPASCRHHG
jgi:hypothetical protein